jgi:hypothetical protein
MIDKVTLLGFGCQPGHRAIYDGCFQGSEVWTCNEWWKAYPKLTKVDRVYQIHTNWTERGGTRGCSDWVERYNASGAVVRTNIDYAGLAKESRFNYEEAVGRRGEDFFSCSWAYAFHDLIDEGFKEVEMVGISPKGDYTFQFELLTAIKTAEKAGVKVVKDNPTEWVRDDAWAPTWGIKRHYGWRANGTMDLKWREQDVKLDFSL